MERVDAAKICCGNPDDKYAVLHNIRKGHFMDSSGSLMFDTHVGNNIECNLVYFAYIQEPRL